MTDSTPTSGDQPPSGQILIYHDGSTQLQVRLDGQTVWLPQRLIADLFQVSLPTVNEHLANIYDEGELDPNPTIRKFRIVQTEGKRQVSRLVDHYNLDAILAVGYRVRSARGTAFRQWATARLSELLVKGFSLDDQRIKEGRTLGDNYFDELLARIRDIRSSERMFYQKITDIYATSIDYDADADLTKTFFQTVQNKMHWAAHGRTAAEIVRLRADASKPHMGLTTWKNAPAGPVRKADVSIAKNYVIKRGNCRGTILTMERRTKNSHEVEYLLRIEEVHRSPTGAKWTVPVISRKSMFVLFDLLHAVEDFLADLDREVELYGRPLQDVLEKVRGIDASQKDV